MHGETLRLATERVCAVQHNIRCQELNFLMPNTALHFAPAFTPENYRAGSRAHRLVAALSETWGLSVRSSDRLLIETHGRGHLHGAVEYLQHL